MSLFSVVRLLVGLFYLVGGPLIHIYFITQNPAEYSAMTATAWPVYQWLWNTLVLPNLYPLVAVLIVVESTMGALMLSPNPRWAQWGHAAAMLFNLLLVPFQFAFGIPNLLTVLLHGWLWREEGCRVEAPSTVDIHGPGAQATPPAR